MRPFVLCYVCDRVHVSVFAYRECDRLAPVTVFGADQGLAATVPMHTTWCLLDAASLGLGYMGTRSCNTDLCIRCYSR